MKALVLNTLKPYPFSHFFSQEVQQRLREIGEVEYYTYTRGETTPEQLMERMADVDVMFTAWGMPALDDEFYKAAPKLKIIAHTGGSVGDLTNGAIQRAGVRILSGNRYYAESVAQATISYMLAGQRRLTYYIDQMAREGWQKEYSYNAGLRFKTVGLVSFGMIAKETARILQVFGCTVKVYSSHGVSEEEQKQYNITTCSLEELFSSCDIISVHSGLTEKTYHMVNRELIALMKEDALIVNTARGAVIDEEALAEAAVAGKIRAVLDVYETEPLPMTSPLRGLENVLLLPHKGGPTIDLYPMVTLGLIDDILRFFRGESMENEISYEYAKNMTSHTAVNSYRK